MKPEPILHELAAAADAVRRGALAIAIHHAGNALLQLKAAEREAAGVPKRRTRTPLVTRRRA